MNLSKSKYCQFVQCPKKLWLSCHKMQEAKVSADVQRRLADGNEVGKLARGLFGRYTDVTIERNGRLDYPAMLQKTKEALVDQQNICEASFCHNGCYCQVDILHKTDNGYEIYEVKSANSVKKINYRDVAFQRQVLTDCGVPVCGVYLVHLNRNYRRQGDLDVSFGGLFERTEELSATLERMQKAVVREIASAKATMQDTTEPQTHFCSECAYCEFFDYCTKDLPEPSVAELAECPQKWEYLNDGIYTMQQLLESGMPLSDKVRQQAEFACYDLPPVIDKYKIRRFLSTLWYPLCFLDFETMQSSLPPFDGTHTYQQIPFQYSLHVIAKEGATLEHKEFLAEPNGDPRRALAEQLTRDIPRGACVVAYNMTFERSVLAELAEQFPDLAPQLLEYSENARDIMSPFHERAYYDRAMRGSYSLKYVTPALFPDEKEADYRNLEGVHNGSEAMDVFPRMKYMTAEELQNARRQLLIYCGYDTLNTVKIWQELVRLSK